MGTAQIIMIVLFTASIIGSAIKHGEEKDKPFNEYNLWVTLIRITIVIVLLYWGGFWK